MPSTGAGGQCVACLLRLALAAESRLQPLPAVGEQNRFGDYELIEEIARGGMGAVWKARQRGLNRMVALKLLLQGQFASEAAIKRFEFEAEAAASLDHPNIVSIYEVGQHQGWPFIAMKLIEGASLAERIGSFTLLDGKDGLHPEADSPGNSNGAQRVPAGLSAGDLREHQTKISALLAKIARAVHYAHQHGVLHRDLKPSNILLDARGEPHVTDFGLARRFTADGRLTMTGAILGSPYYMSPEQAAGAGAALTTATDTYSLGVILFELLTARLPFFSETPVATLRLILENPPPRPRSLNPVIDADLQTICLKCLDKDPAARYSSAEALADDLENWLEGRPIRAVRSGAAKLAFKWIKREPLKAGSIAAILLAAILSSYVTGRISAQRLGHMAIQHAVETANSEGQFLLKVIRYKEDSEHRVTNNFWRYGFDPPAGMLVRLDFIGVPADLLPSLRCLIRADQPGRPDPPRTGVVTNGQSFVLKYQSDLDRNFYVASVGWSARDLLAQASNAVVRLTLVTNKTVQTEAPPQVRP